MADTTNTTNTIDLSQYKLTKGEADWQNKYNALLDAIGPIILAASTSSIKYGTGDPSNSGWKPGDIYVQIEG